VDIFAPAAAPVLALLGFRLGGLVLIAPMFASRSVPNSLKAGLIVVLTATLFPVALGSASANLRVTPATALTETVIGLAIGLAVAVIVGAAEAMGDLAAIQMGLSGAAALDPLSNNSVPVLGTFASLFAMTLLLSVDGHLMMIQAVADSLSFLPVGGALELEAGLATMISWGSTLFMLATRFAAPIIAAVLLANVALAVLSRAAPALNILSVAFPIQIGLGLFALAGSIPLIGAFFGGWTGFFDGMMTQLFDSLVPVGGS
jgi:flagellar biosynthetic protein FliR